MVIQRSLKTFKFLNFKNFFDNRVSLAYLDFTWTLLRFPHDVPWHDVPFISLQSFENLWLEYLWKHKKPKFSESFNILNLSLVVSCHHGNSFFPNPSFESYRVEVKNGKTGETRGLTVINRGWQPTNGNLLSVGWSRIISDHHPGGNYSWISRNTEFGQIVLGSR